MRHFTQKGIPMNWFSVDKAGLAAVLERRGKFFAVAELVANAWDSGTDRVEVSLVPIEGIPFAVLTVEDMGEGFSDLSHSHTMFARSSRGEDPSKRGRFMLGEKLVLACCRSAGIESTCGSIQFSADGVKRHTLGRAVGTRFEAEIRMTRDEFSDVCDRMLHLIPPVRTTFNGVEIDRPDSIARFDVKLPTEIADTDGLLRRTVRTATVEVYEATDGGELLELGIPVVELDAGYRVNVLQKIPLNMDRDNVNPGFVRAIQAALLNHVHEQLTPDEAAKPWAQEAAGDARASRAAVKSIIKTRFGDHAVIATPGDPVANARAEAAGFTVIPGGALSGDLWANIKKNDVLLPSSKVFPTPRPDQVAAQREGAGTCPTCGRSF